MSAMLKPPIEDATVAAARELADLLVAQGFTAEQCAVLAFVKGASFGLGKAMTMGRGDDNVPGWPTT
jgi:hypothetical protein